MICFMICLLLIAGNSFCCGFNLLLIGDSFDRYYVNEWCEDNAFAHHSYSEKANFVFPYGIIWGDKSFMDKQWHNTPFFCRDSSNNNTVAQIQIFGSSMKGPYYADRNSASETTSFRVKTSLSNYFNLTDSVPDRIMIHTTQWDVIYPIDTIWSNGSRTDSQFQAFLDQKDRDINKLIDVIEDIVNLEIQRRQRMQLTFSSHKTNSQKQSSSWLENNRTSQPSSMDILSTHSTIVSDDRLFDTPSTTANNTFTRSTHQPQVDYFAFKCDIGLRSTTRTSYPLLIIQFNEMVHNISIRRNLTWFDLDADLWATVDYHRTPEYYRGSSKLFRDETHSVRAFSVPTLSKLMGILYTQFLTHHGGTQRVSHIITTQAQLNSNTYKNMNFQLVRMTAIDQSIMKSKHGLLTHRQIHNAAVNHPKNQQIPPITDITVTNITHTIPGYGPIYYSMFVNGSRVKWLVGNESSNYLAQFTKHHQLNSTNLTKYQQGVSANTQYELTMRPILERLLLSVSDLVLLDESILSTIPTQGVMFTLFNPLTLAAFTTTATHKNNSDECNLYVMTPDNTIRQVPQNVLNIVQELLALHEIPILANIDTNSLQHRYKILTASSNEFLSPKLFQNNALIRHHKSKYVQMVLNLTRHDFAKYAFIQRGYDFSNVVPYDDSAAIFVDLMPFGNVLTGSDL